MDWKKNKPSFKSRIVGWVKRSETQQIPSHGWVSLPRAQPTTVMQGLEAALATDATLIYSWVALRRTAIELGYPETATWIESHLDKYVLGVERGFIAEDSQ